jgi:hypothetical protein
MAAFEEVNRHLHDAGWLRFDWNYYTDKSVDDAIAEFARHAHEPGGINVDHVMAFIRSATDSDQITDREARMLVAVLNGQIPNMTLEAKRLVDAFTQRMNTPGRDIFNTSDEMYSDESHDLFDGIFGTSPHRTGAGDEVIAGEEMHSFIAQLDQIAHPWDQLAQIDRHRFTNLGDIIKGW